MSEALPLFDYAAQARRGDPPTSHKAALTMKAGTLRERVFGLLADGPRAEFEIVNLINPLKRVSISPRFAELQDHGLIRKVGTRINPDTNKECFVWERIAS